MESQNRLFFETHCSALSNGPSSSHMPLLTNLKTHLIIRISKGQAIDGKRETKNYGNMDLQNHRLSDKLYYKGEVVKVWHKVSCSAGVDEICYLTLCSGATKC